MSKINEILFKYWGHKEFRPLQEEIIHSILEGKDTLALLPTGGGKSICFVVPALAKPGICIVVSPLIALMKDQVYNLNKRGIPAVCIVSGMDKREIDILLDNCVYGDIKFLYVSPERLQTKLFIDRVKKMKVSFLAVDEAHCISQWGYDFRPPYLKIAELREIIPQLSIIALTATATPDVVNDIQDKLKFKTKNVFQKSFSRSNLAYLVRKDEDKWGRLLRICNRIKGTGIVYVRNRKKTKEIAEFLQRNKISVAFYHAGLDQQKRAAIQEDWIKNKTRIIVSTNAFGMGIDKPDVRFVVHLDIPDSPEAYFQEAGRGGRDELKAWGIILYSEADVVALEDGFKNSFPDLEAVKKTYFSLGNYYKLAVGSLAEDGFEFNISDFSKKFSLNPIIAFNSIKILENAGYIQMSDAFYSPSRIKIIVNQTELYAYQISNKNLDSFIKILLRSYTALFDEFIKISESELAKRMQLSVDEIKRYLQKMDEQQILVYIPQSELPRITFPVARIAEKEFNLAPEIYHQRKLAAKTRMEAMKNYVADQHHCRSLLLLNYFGEKEGYRCGICDYCLKENHLKLSNIEVESITAEIKQLVQKEFIDVKSLKCRMVHHNEDKLKVILRWLLDNDQLIITEANYLRWKE